MHPFTTKPTVIDPGKRYQKTIRAEDPGKKADKEFAAILIDYFT